MFKTLMRPIRALLNSQSAKFRIALGQASILISILLIAAFAGLVPDRTGAILEGRAAMAEAIAANSSVFITRSDLRRIEANLQFIVDRNEELLSAGVRNAHGRLVADVGQHEIHWQPIDAGISTQSQLQVPIMERERPWGSVELLFTPASPQGKYAFFKQPLTILIVTIASLSFGCFYLYLGVMLRHLDPSQAIPDRVRSALDTIAEGLLVLDGKQNIVLANSAFEKLVGSSAAKLIGLKIASFPWSLEDIDNPQPGDWPWHQAMQQAESRLGVVVKMADPEDPEKSRTFMVNCSPVLADSGSAKGVLVSFDDITELEEKEVQLRLSMQMAEDANQAKSDFLANMSHEIRTPMNAILGFTEILKRGAQKTPEESTKYLNTIASSGQHLLNLINDILDLSKVESGHMEMEVIDCQLHTVIKEVAKIMNVKAEQQNITLEFCPEGALPETIQSDPGRLRQALTNLVGNAIKFTEHGGVKIVARFDAGGEQPSIVVEVCDTGIGMTQEQADNIFNPFTQADNSISRRFGGTGLGLTISKNFVEALGGSIAVRSVPGEGSTFILVIPTGAIDGVPMLDPAALLEESAVASYDSNQRWQFAASRVLVVDDGVENRELLQVVLGDLGLDIDTAENGKIGLDKTLANDYNIVLMDVNMPVMDGLESVGLMREKGIAIPIIALTASAMKGSEEECLQAGYSGYMAKPIVIDQLTELLAKELGGVRVAIDEPAALVAAPSLVAATDIADTDLAGKESPAPVNDAQTAVQAPALRSSLLEANPKFRPIVEKFVLRLADQVNAFEKAWDAKDYKQLADLAHWLKGSAGSVGFEQFTAVAAELEQQAKRENEVYAAELITEIRSKYERIDVTPAPASAAAPQATASQATAPQAAMSTSAAKLTSTLPTTNAKFAAIVCKFGERMDQQVLALRAAIDAEDYATVKDLAHWLKGSAGSVGFPAFTEPAAELEQAAIQGAGSAMRDHFAVIDDLRQRMVIPDQPADEGHAAQQA